MSETLYKVLRENGETTFGRSGWDLPNGKAGKWRRVTGKLIECENGLHVCRADQLLEWLGPCLYEVETRGRIVDAGNKIVARQARLVRAVETWNEVTLRLFSADCAEHALLRERKLGREPDPRLWTAVEAARAFARGEIGDAARSAAGSAAGSAVRSAAWSSAARSAAESAAWSAARPAAWSAAGSAAWFAAWSAAWSAARPAERDWQNCRLLEYIQGEHVA